MNDKILLLLLMLFSGWTHTLVLRPLQSESLSTEPLSDDTRYVELYLVIDYTLFSAFGSKETTIASCQEIADALDTIFSRSNLRILLTGVEIWQDIDRMNITTTASDVLNGFLSYANTHIKEADSVHLLTAKKFSDGIVGLAYVGAMCWTGYSGSICHYNPQVDDYSEIVTTLAHEIGHNLNMTHDDTYADRTCYCEDPSGVCLMYSRKRTPSQKMFSSCSIDVLHKYVSTELVGCLNNQPTVTPFDEGARCGNNKLDLGEECDCGVPEYCISTCCDAATCKLKSNADCSIGLCCHNCKLATNQTICRSAENECDVTDYCDGVISSCDNSIVENGNPCSNSGACFKGECMSRELQCKYLWGPEAIDGDRVCYEKINKAGERYGHCGKIEDGLFLPCLVNDTFCGKLHCSNAAQKFPIIGFSSGYSRIGMQNSNDEYITCLGGTADMGINQTDAGLVPDGTPCGQNMSCYDNKCVERSSTSSCIPACGVNQVCTNKGVCVCDWEHTRDDCSLPLKYKVIAVSGSDERKPWVLWLILTVFLAFLFE